MMIDRSAIIIWALVVAGMSLWLHHVGSFRWYTIPVQMFAAGIGILAGRWASRRHRR